jgi:hypothetical protein
MNSEKKIAENENDDKIFRTPMEFAWSCPRCGTTFYSVDREGIDIRRELHRREAHRPYSMLVP